MVGLTNSFPSGYSYLVSHDGTFLAHHDTRLVSEQYNPIRAAETDSSVRSLADVISKALREKDGHAEYFYDGDLTQIIAVHTKDEIGNLAISFNKTLGGIRELVSVIKNKVHALSNTGHELSVHMEKNSDAVQDISSKFEDIKKLEDKQNAEAEDVN